MDILTLTSQYMYIFMLGRSNAIILGHSFQHLRHFRFWRPFWIFRFQSFIDQKLLSKCAHDAYFRSQEVKTYQIGYLTWKNSFICKKMTFWRPFCTFWPRISTGSWQRRKLNYNPKPSYEKYYSHTKLQENRIKTVVVTVPSFFWQIWRPWRHKLC